jgi:NitT/TauT family transport system substrate-binding protein
MGRQARSSALVALVVTVVAGLLFSCGPTQGSSLPQTGKKVSFILDYLPGAVHLGFYSALANGYYHDAGLDVQIVPGRGSLTAAGQVATGAATLGFADFSAVAKGVVAGQRIKMVAGMLQRGAFGLSYLCTTPIHTPKDLKGKRIATVAGEATYLLLLAMMATNGLKESDITRIITDTSASNSTVLSGRADARTTTIYDQSLQIAAAKIGKQGCAMAFGDQGIVTMGHGIIASDNLIASDPDLIKRFVAASMKGWQFAIDNPDRARALMLSQARDVDEETVRTGWPVIPHLLHTDRTQGRPLGYMAPEDIDATLTLLKDTGIITQRLPADQYFTDKFVSS